MISGTNELLGAAAGAFIVHKANRTIDKAILEVVGRDQADQRLHLLFDREQCIWWLTEAEKELWQEPTDSLLEIVAELLTIEAPKWRGSASELISRLSDKAIEPIEIQPNVLTRRLNVGEERLWNEYRSGYKSSRGHLKRFIELKLISSKT